MFKPHAIPTSRPDSAQGLDRSGSETSEGSSHSEQDTPMGPLLHSPVFSNLQEGKPVSTDVTGCNLDVSGT
ncbi:hypothetical protein E2C01_100110 [Portunus trituberculatus]|uniref:Uncharacterized protein n=1 Tax=Portunus trituberculatus TaxID=210409 RepID=A0A5B7KCG8_PORTR|nr:hypothetical protein [Portunus trituberculatus]